LAKQVTKTVEKPIKDIVVDGTNLIAGRLCSNVAKLLLQGNNVSVVNCEKIMISGKRLSIVGEYKDFLKIASILHPKHGPFHPRRPDTILSRMVRGMLPRKKPSGQVDNAKIRKPNAYYTSMAELGRTIGWNE
jgi:large subunit ribosomal protein L13